MRGWTAPFQAPRDRMAAKRRGPEVYKCLTSNQIPFHFQTSRRISSGSPRQRKFTDYISPATCMHTARTGCRKGQAGQVGVAPSADELRDGRRGYTSLRVRALRWLRKRCRCIVSLILHAYTTHCSVVRCVCVKVAVEGRDQLGSN